MSTRNSILKVLCNPTIFYKGWSGYSNQVVDKVLPYLSEEDKANVINIENSIRQVLETIDGYQYSNGTSAIFRRDVLKEQESVQKSARNPHGYVIKYTFL